MFVTVKKPVFILSTILLLLVYSLFTIFYQREYENIETFCLPSSNKIIVIDPGHGGIDDGASKNGVKEKDLNLKIALKLRQLIEQSAGITILSRETDVSAQNPNRHKSLSPKTSDLLERRKLADESKADLFISIHMNVFPENQSVRGGQVFYSNNNENSKIFGNLLQNSINESINDKPKKATSAKGHIFVLKKIDVPAALLECGFLTNPNDLTLLQNDDYQLKIAWSIYQAITEFFRTMQ